MKKSNKLLIVYVVISLVSTLVFSSFSSAAAYPTIEVIYNAEKFLLDDSLPVGATMPDGGTNLNKYMGVEQSPVFGGSALDKVDKKEGNSSLKQTATTGGQGLNFWACGEEKFGDKVLNVSAYKNPGIHMWLYVSDPNNIGGDKSSTNDQYGSIIMDFGSGSVGGAQNDSNREAFWIFADSLVKGWNEITVPVKPSQIDTTNNQVTLNGKTFGFTKSDGAVDFSAVNWWRLIVKSRKALVIKIDDVRFVDLGNASTSTVSSTTSSKPASSATVSSKPSTSQTTSTANSDILNSSDIVSGSNSSISQESGVMSDSSNSDVSTVSGDASSKDDTKDTSNVSPLLIIGIILGVIALGGIGFFVYYFLIKQKKQGM